MPNIQILTEIDCGISEIREAIFRTYRETEALRTFFSSAGQGPFAYTHAAFDESPITITTFDTFQEELRAARNRIFRLTAPHPYEFLIAPAILEGRVQLGIVMPHLLVDWQGINALERAIRANLHAAGPVSDRVTVPRSSELAREQVVRTGFSRVESRLRQSIASAPATLFPMISVSDRSVVGLVNEFSIKVQSPALGAAVLRWSEDWKVLPSAVVMAAFSIALSSYTGSPNISTWFVSANRPRRLQYLVANLASLTPVVVQTHPHHTFRDIATLHSKEIVNGILSAQAPDSLVWEVESQVAAARQCNIRWDSRFNFYAVSGQIGRGADVYAVVEKDSQMDQPHVALDCYVDGDQTVLDLEASSLAISRDDGERMLRSIVKMISSTQRDNWFEAESDTDVVWLPTKRALYSESRVASIIRSLPGVLDCELTAGSALRLHASVDSLDRDAVQGLLDALHTCAAVDPTFVLPDSAVLRTIDGTSLDVQLNAEFDRRSSLTWSPVLCELMAIVSNFLERPDPNKAFLSQGGSYDSLVQVVAELRSRGFLSATVDTFRQYKTLRMVAACL